MFCRVTLDKIPYYAFSFCEKKSAIRLLVLMENMLLFHPAFDEYLIGEGLSLMKGVYEASTETGGTSSLKTVSFSDRLAARTRRFREEGRIYRNYLEEGKRPRSAPCSCDLSAFFPALTEKLEKYRRSLIYHGKKGLCVLSSPEDIVYCILNLLQFAVVFEGEKNLEIFARQTEKKVIFSVEIQDRERLFEVLSQLIGGERDEGLFPLAMGIPPLLSLALFCRREKERFLLRRKGDACVLEFSLPATKLSPVGFLGTEDSKEKKTLDEILREYFS